MKNTLKILAVAFSLAFLGGILSGCDDGSNPNVAATSDSGHTDVQPTSGTTDTRPTSGTTDVQPASPNPACSASNAVVATFVTGQTGQASKESLVAEVQSLCVGWVGTKDSRNMDAANICETNYQTIYGMTPATSLVVCSTLLTTVECQDVTHNFVDTAGVMHGLLLGKGTDGLWTLGGFGVLLRTDAVPVCTQDGMLLGLMTTSKG